MMMNAMSDCPSAAAPAGSLAERQDPLLMPASTSNVTLPHLRAWRIERLMPQTELARKADVGVSTLVRAEAGGVVHALTARRIARALGVTVKQLQTEEPAQ